MMNRTCAHFHFRLAFVAALMMAAFCSQIQQQPCAAQSIPKLLWDQGEEAGAIQQVAYSPNGALIATGRDFSAVGDHSVKVWRTSDHMLLDAFGVTGTPVLVAFSADNSKVIAADTSGAVNEWKIAGASLVASLGGFSGSIQSATLAPDGHTIVVGSSDGTLQIRDLNGIAASRSIPAHAGPVESVAVSPDGQTIGSACSVDQTAKIWNMSDGSLRCTFNGPENGLDAFGPVQFPGQAAQKLPNNFLE